MFIDHINAADSVSRWSSLGGLKLPADLKKALAVFDALRWVEVGHVPTFDLAGVTAENAEGKVTELASRLLPSMPVAGDQHRTPLEEAKQRMLAEAARDVLSKAGTAVPVVIEQLQPEFDKHAAAYVAAVELLPETVDSDALVRAGAGAVQAYAIAQTEAAWLYKVSSWVAGTRNLPGYAGQSVEVVLRILRPADAVQLAKLDAAHQTLNVNQTLGALDPVLYTAAKEGVEFGINTLRECAEIRASLAITTQKVGSGVTMIR